MPTFRGKPACSCQVAWIPAYEAELQRRGIIAESAELTIYQLIGGAPASGGTHTQGGAWDSAYYGPESIAVARQMGADATWLRPYNWDGRGGMAHVHGVLRGCEHNWPARYQITAVDDGYNGLGHLGQGARDDGPRPLSGRTWRDGIAWASEQGDEMKPDDWTRIDARFDALEAKIAATPQALLDTQIETPKGKRSFGQMLKELWNKRNV